MRMAVHVDDRDIVAFYSGDTIVAREYWGETELSRLWSRTVFAGADRILAQRPETRVYWFLICSGYKTWRFLPVFFQGLSESGEVYTTAHSARSGCPGRKKIRASNIRSRPAWFVRSATPLRQGVADVTEQRLRDPRVVFFAA